MTMPFFIEKYVKQIKAMNPKYDKPCEVSKLDPITFTDSEKVKLSFVALADTHLPDRNIAEKNLENIFTDISLSKEKIDALILAGDIADYGFAEEYRRFFRVFTRHKNELKLLITMGNHDVRLFYKTALYNITNGIEELLGTDLNGKPYYSYSVNGYKFIVLATEKPYLLEAYISPEQIEFLKKELEEASAENKPCFVICHQPFDNTHGLPKVCKNGSIGKQNNQVRAVLEKHKNIFFLNGHLHSGICDYVESIINKENNVISINLPSYRKENNFGSIPSGAGYICEVYEDKVIFKARSLLTGGYIKGHNTYFEYPLIF